MSGILVGSAYAYLSIAQTHDYPSSFSEAVADKNPFDFTIVLLGLLTTLGFQILSNFANDYGDGVKGTDNEDRIGPVRAIQSGVIKKVEMKNAIILTAVLSFISAVSLIYLSLGLERLMISVLFLLLGIAAIWAAIKYTVGDNAYGYRGLGDVFVFLFFEPVSVMGIAYLLTATLDLWLLLPSFTVGLLSVSVLNLNNMRDFAGDKKAGKNTIVVALGFSAARRLHYAIIATAIISALVYYFHIYLPLKNSRAAWLFIPAVAFFLLMGHVARVVKTNSPALLDPELKKVALTTFAYALLSILSVYLVTA